MNLDCGASGHPSGETGSALRDLIEAEIVHEAPAGKRPGIQVKGYLPELIGGQPFLENSMPRGSVVAEEGFEPPTHGL